MPRSTTLTAPKVQFKSAIWVNLFRDTERFFRDAKRVIFFRLQPHRPIEVGVVVQVRHGKNARAISRERGVQCHFPIHAIHHVLHIQHRVGIGAHFGFVCFVNLVLFGAERRIYVNARAARVHFANLALMKGEGFLQRGNVFVSRLVVRFSLFVVLRDLGVRAIQRLGLWIVSVLCAVGSVHSRLGRLFRSLPFGASFFFCGRFVAHVLSVVGSGLVSLHAGTFSALGDFGFHAHAGANLFFPVVLGCKVAVVTVDNVELVAHLQNVDGLFFYLFEVLHHRFELLGNVFFLAHVSDFVHGNGLLFVRHVLKHALPGANAREGGMRHADLARIVLGNAAAGTALFHGRAQEAFAVASLTLLADSSHARFVCHELVEQGAGMLLGKDFVHGRVTVSGFHELRSDF